MPNNCDNNLTVYGDRESLKKFCEATLQEDGTFSIASLYPMPDVLEGTTMPTPDSPEPHPNWAESLAKGEITQEWHDELVASRRSKYEAGVKALAETGYSNWWDWCLENWGTKWGDYDHFAFGVSDYEHFLANPGVDSIEFGYLTAWCPFSDKFWHNVSRQFPTLNFIVSYDESGMVFCGASAYRNGETVAERYIDDYTKVIGEANWDDDDSVGEWLDKMSDLRGMLYSQVESAL